VLGSGARFAPVRLSAIVPATDGPLSLARCEAAIHSAHDGPDELIVVSDADGGRPGPAAARNAGAARASGDVLVFVDSDVAVHPDAFARIRAAFERDPGLAGVFGSYDDEPDAGGTVSRFRNLLHHHVHQESAGPVASFWSGLGAVRRDAFEAAGGFDEQRFTVSSMEDVELGMRLASAGARVELDPEIRGKHLKGWTLASMIRTDVVRRGAPWVAVLMRRRELPGELNLSRRHRVAAAGWVGAAGALLALRPRLALAAAALATAANAPFYTLLARRMGPRGAIAGVGLHAVHYLAAAAAIPVGVLFYLRGTRSAREDVSVRVEGDTLDEPAERVTAARR
jgi:GT2 family glycosyltransferase